MKIREIIKLKGLESNTSVGPDGTDLFRDLLGPIDGSGTEASPQVGRVGVPPRWEIDRIADQAKRLPHHRHSSRRR
jgi:hypothetical protein